MHSINGQMNDSIELELLINEDGEEFLSYERNGKPFVCYFNKYYEVLHVNYFINDKILQLGTIIPDGGKPISIYMYKFKGYNIEDRDFDNATIKDFRNVILSIQ